MQAHRATDCLPSVTPTPNYGVTECTEVHETPAEKQALKENIESHSSLPVCLLWETFDTFTELLVFMLITLCAYGKNTKPYLPTNNQITPKLQHKPPHTVYNQQTQYLQFFFGKINTTKLSSILYRVSFSLRFSLSLSLWKWTSRRTRTVVRNIKRTLHLFFSLSEGVCLREKKELRVTS